MALVPRGLPTEALVAHSMVARFGDDLPFHRRSEISRRQGIDRDGSMLAEWSGRAAQLPAPVIDAMMDELRRSDRLQMDETTVPVPAPARAPCARTGSGSCCATSGEPANATGSRKRANGAAAILRSSFGPALEPCMDGSRGARVFRLMLA